MAEPRIDQYKRELLYRKAHGKKLMDAYLSKVAQLFPSGKQPELLALEETDIFLNKFRLLHAELHKEAFRIFPSKLHVELLIIRNSDKKFHVMIDEDWKYCGMLKSREIKLLNTYAMFGEMILNDMVFISDDMSFAYHFDFSQENGVDVIDVTKWRKIENMKS